MAQLPTSPQELLASGLAQDEKSKLIFGGGPTDVNTFSNNLVARATGLFENLNNLTGNIVDTLSLDEESNIIKAHKKDLYDPKLNTAEKLWESTKNLFNTEPTTVGGFKAILDLANPAFAENIKQANNNANDKRSEYMRQNALQDQFATGQAGDILSEMFLAIPTMNVGHLARTREAIGGMASAKAIAKDAVENSGTFAGSEFVLQKLYGRSDEEAVANSMVAGLLGGLGTTGAGAGLKGLQKSAKAESELQAQMAGGGVPTKEQVDEMLKQQELDALERETYTPDITPEKNVIVDSKGQQITSPSELEALKNVEDITYKSVEPEATPRKPIEGQKEVSVEDRTFKTEMKPEFRKRVMTKEKSYRSIQGGATQKAGLEIQPKAKLETVSDVDNLVKKEVKMFKEDQALEKAFGQKQGKFKQKKAVSKQQQDINAKDFEIKKLKDISTDKTKPSFLREHAKTKAFELEKKQLNTKGASQKEIDTAKKKYYDQIKIEKPTVKSKNLVNREFRTQFKAVQKNNKAQFNAEKEATLQTKSPEITKLLEKELAVNENAVKDALQEIKIKEGLKGKRFSEKSITPEQRKKYRDETKLIENYQHTLSDLEAFKKGNISASELVFRAGRRLEDQLSREGKSAFKDDKELQTQMSLIKDRYKELGISKNIEILKEDKFKKSDKPSNLSQAEIDDFAEGKRIEREAIERDEASMKHAQVVRNIEEFRRTGEVARKKKTGEKILSDKQIDLAKRKELSSEQIADLTAPKVPKKEIPEAKSEAQKKIGRQANTASMKRLGMKGTLTKEGPKFREQKPFDIKHKQSIVDASNSAGQILAVVMGSKRLGSLTKLTGETLDLRSEIAKVMSKNTGREFTKDDVKPAFIQQMYGETAEKTKKVFELEEDFFQYEKALEEIAPEVKSFREEIYKLMENGQKDFSWKLPDGATVDFTLEGVDKAKLKVGDKIVEIQVKTGDINMMSRALMPNMIHSIDAYVVRQLNKKGIPTIHDAFSETADIGADAVQDAFLDAMIKLNDSNVLHDIMTDIGYKGKPLKQGTLTKDDILRSRGISAEVEHASGTPEEVKARKLDNSKVYSDEDLMKEYMAKDMGTATSAKFIVEELTDSAPFNSSIAVAKEGDSVMQRQVALAHQSPNFNKELSIQPTNGIDEKLFWKVQRDIFDEARAKLEYNPLTENTIQGEPRFFKNQKPIGDTTIDIEKLIQQEKRINNSIEEGLSTPKLERVKVQAERTPLLKGEEVDKLDKQISKSIEDTSVLSKELGLDTPFNETITNWKSGYKSTGAYGQINKLHTLTRNSLNQSAKVGAVTKNVIDKMYKKSFKTKAERDIFDYEFQRAVLDTDSISHGFYNKQDAMKFLRENKELYNRLKREIDQSAKGMKNKGEMNHPDYFQNTAVLAKAKGISQSDEAILDKLISIKAMEDSNWKFLETNKDSDIFKSMELMVKRAKTQTQELFANDPTNSMKGYRLETYDSLYRMKSGVKEFDVGDGIEQGALPVDILAKRVGNRDFELESKELLKYNKEFAREEALSKGLGLVFDRLGNPIGLRKVATEIERMDLGRKVSAIETLSSTLEANTRKLSQMDGVIKEARRMVDEGNDIISKDFKEGFVELTEQEIKSLPKELRDIRFVNQDFKHMLMGNKEIQLFDEGMKAVVEQVYKDGFVHFKQNVVLKNPASWVNNYAFGLFMNYNAGMPVKEAFKESAKGPAIYKDMQRLTELLMELDIKGKSDSPRAKSIKAKLEKNEIYQMVQEGMAVSVMADMMRTSGKATLFTDRAVSKGLRSVIGDKATDVLSNIYIHSASDTGKIANSMFTRIDVMHRYALVKGMMKKGMTLKEAVAKSNGVYGDLDKITPMWSQAIQHYGFIPFSNWFFRVSGGLQDTTKKNIVRTIGLSAGLYGLSELTDKRTESMNPLLTLVNTPIDMLEMSPYFQPANAIKNAVQPKVYSKAYRAVDNEDPLSFAISENFKG